MTQFSANAVAVNGHSKKQSITTNGSSSIEMTSKHCIDLEEEYSAHNYHPLPVVFSRASGAHVFDVEGRQYIDCLSAYSAVNQGHCHPKIVQALVDQAQQLTLASRAFHTDKLGQYAEKITKLLGFDMVLPMNTGAEAVETALKLARKWAYNVKKVPKDKAIILSATENFHGRTLGIVSMSTDVDATNGFGPFLDTVGAMCPVQSESRRIRYNNINDLERALDAHGEHVAAFLVEPIQGEAGIIIPDENYLERCQDLCRKHNVLFICDEIQTGLGRTGKMLCYQHNPRVKPDIVTLGKALSGGIYPVSAVLSSRQIMLNIKPGEHGSTYGGNPLACAVAIAALDVLVDEKLAERAELLEPFFRKMLEDLRNLGVDGPDKRGWITSVRCKGLFCAIDINSEKQAQVGKSAFDLCMIMARKGVLAKPTHQNTIRLAPPLVISKGDLTKVAAIIRESLEEMEG